MENFAGDIFLPRTRAFTVSREVLGLTQLHLFDRLLTGNAEGCGGDGLQPLPRDLLFTQPTDTVRPSLKALPGLIQGLGPGC